MRKKDIFSFAFETFFNRSWGLTQGKGLFTRVDHLRQTNRLFANIEISALKYLFSRYNFDYAIDVGANRGQYYWFLRKVTGYNGIIISIEPALKDFEHLVNVGKNDPKHIAINCACGDQKGKALLNLSKDSKLNSFYKNSAYSKDRFRDKIDSTGQIEVEIRTLEEILSSEIKTEGKPNLFVKTDTQGHDRYVISGLGEWLPCVLAIQSELSLLPVYEGVSDYVEIVKFFENQGFNLFSCAPVTRDKNDNSIIELNGFFVKRDVARFDN
jgi:FkbM family methyltransferase